VEFSNWSEKLNTTKQLKILVLAPACDETDVGEAWCAYQWVIGLAKRHEVTLLTMRKANRLPASKQLDNVEVVEWDDLPIVHHWERLNSMLKPGYIRFYKNARRWIRFSLASGRQFDVAHQFTPIALRYPSPVAGMGIPFVIGPLAGSLDTPKPFQPECGNAPWYTRLRGLDVFRLRHDPLLRHTYKDAHVVIGVAPYVKNLFADMPIKRFEMMSELGVNDVPKSSGYKHRGNVLRLAHVGRVIRTKGLRDVIRAIAMLDDSIKVTLESAGDGEDLNACRIEARALGVEDQIVFHGNISREHVEDVYRRADAFIFPSFREPSGSVIFESLRHGLPVITTDLGGPAYVVDESCGIRVPAETPDKLAAHLATAIKQLAQNPGLISRLSEGALNRIQTVGMWPKKIDWLSNLYEEILSSSVINEGKL
jgi:glycosyltransferase involved in cell wall biosynthesis